MPYCKIRDLQLYYEIHGDGQPLLFLHGLGSSSRDWYNQVEYFSKTFRVVTLDLRGHGRSDRPRSAYSIPLLAEDVAAFIEEIELQPIHITGLSMGGMVALQLSLDRPDLVRTVAAVNCGVDYRLNSVHRWSVYLTRCLLVMLFGPRALGLYLSRRLLPNPDHEELRQAFMQRYAENDRRTLLACINAIAGWTILDRLHEIRQPTLIVAAEHDYSTVAEKLSWAPLIPRVSFMMIPDTHHAVPVEEPWRFNEQLDSFLEFHTASDLALPTGTEEGMAKDTGN